MNNNSPWAFTWHNYITRNWQGIELTPQESNVLLMLILHSNRYVHRNNIIEFLWPDAEYEPTYAVKVVREYVYRLRRKLPVPIHSNQNNGYRIIIPDVDEGSN